MRLGIDFGTTRTIVATVDRGNYPLVTFDTENGSGCEWYPGVFAFRDNEILTGFKAQEKLNDPSWTIHRSIKRLLSRAGPMDTVAGLEVRDLMTRFLSDLKVNLLEHSNLNVQPNEPLEVAVAVPAHATANQRLITMDAFQKAGFHVIRMLDEPSAAGLEYAWRRPADAMVRKRLLAVYDLGGGTFDASFIELNEDLHEVVTTEGLHDLGGDNFDKILLNLTGVTAEPKDLAGLLEICRMEKERFNPNTRNLNVDIHRNGFPVSVSIEDFENALRPLIDRSLSALELALSRAESHFGTDMHKHTVVYQVGGASSLPTVGRMLRERFGRRVWRSPYPHGSIAIGLAIAAEESNTPRIKARFTRNFGVWREGDFGNNATFDSIFLKDALLPDPGQPPLEVRRRYRSAHNIAHFRFVECSTLAENGTPRGDVMPWKEVRFPLISTLYGQTLENKHVERLNHDGDEIEELFRCDANGIITVEISNLSANYSSQFTLHGEA